MANVIDENMIGVIEGISHSGKNATIRIMLVKLRYDNGDIRWRCRIGNKTKYYFDEPVKYVSDWENKYLDKEYDKSDLGTAFELWICMLHDKMKFIGHSWEDILWFANEGDRAFCQYIDNEIIDYWDADQFHPNFQDYIFADSEGNDYYLI